MKKVLCTSLILLLILSGITVAFAAESAKTTTVAATGASTTTTTSSAVTSTTSAIVPDMTFAGTPINLSLENAYKKMLTDSSGAQMAELNKQVADGVAKGYSESIHSIMEAKRDNEVYDSSNKKMANANREFSATQGPRNYEAEINSLKSSTLENYYTLKELERQVEIARENLDLKEKLLANTQLKYKLGTVSKNEVLEAELAVNEAKDSLISATNGLNKMKMSFNQFMGYNLMQNVALTDEIKEIPLSTKSLTDSIKDALVKRNEIHEAAFNLNIATLNLNSYYEYPKSSSKYIAAQMSLLMAQTASDNAPLTVEIDVRDKYMKMNEKYAAVQTGKKSVENSKESLRLLQLQYDAGMATLSDVEGAQLNYYNKQLAYSKALLEYNLAVDDYNLSSTVGTETATIK